MLVANIKKRKTTKTSEKTRIIYSRVRNAHLSRPIYPRVNPLGKPRLGFKPYFGKVGNTGE